MKIFLIFVAVISSYAIGRDIVVVRDGKLVQQKSFLFRQDDPQLSYDMKINVALIRSGSVHQRIMIEGFEKIKKQINPDRQSKYLDSLEGHEWEVQKPVIEKLKAIQIVLPLNSINVPQNTLYRMRIGKLYCPGKFADTPSFWKYRTVPVIVPSHILIDPEYSLKHFYEDRKAWVDDFGAVHIRDSIDGYIQLKEPRAIANNEIFLTLVEDTGQLFGDKFSRFSLYKEKSYDIELEKAKAEIAPPERPQNFDRQEFLDDLKAGTHFYFDTDLYKSAEGSPKKVLLTWSR